MLVKRNNQCGFVMLEVLVCAVILSTTFMSLLYVELSSLSDIRMVASDQTADTLITNIAERIRANSEYAIDGHYQATAAPSGAACTSNCSQADTTQADLINWFNAINDYSSTSILPNASAEINFQGSASGVASYEIIVRWVEFHSHNSAALLATSTREITRIVEISS